MKPSEFLGLCVSCKYNLTGVNNATCPECGTVQPIAWIPESHRPITIEELQLLQTVPPAIAPLCYYFLRSLFYFCLIAISLLFLFYLFTNRLSLSPSILWIVTVSLFLIAVGASFYTTIKYKAGWQSFHNNSASDMEAQQASVVRISVVSALQINVAIPAKQPWYSVSLKHRFQTLKIVALKSDTGGCIILPSTAPTDLFHGKNYEPKEHLVFDIADASGTILRMAFEGNDVPIFIIHEIKPKIFHDSFCSGTLDLIPLAIQGISKHLPPDFK